MAHFSAFTSRLIPLLVNDIDTDQIIPARFLKVTDKYGLGQNLFADWRYNADGSPNADFVLNKKEYAGSEILLAGDNFGCGSSREHAPWALRGFGFRAVISTSFADIFKSNSLKNGLLPVTVDPKVHDELRKAVEQDNTSTVSIDLASQTLTLLNGKSVVFPIDNFSKTCLLNGVDELGYLMQFMKQIEQYETQAR